jgi:outer membrane receptor protein involved in Fe transport
VAFAQAPELSGPPVTQIAVAATGTIAGTVADERGQPLDGVVVSAMGGSTSFAVSDRSGQFTLRSLTPGPYLLRAHLDGYIPARGTMINVRPAGRTTSTFRLRRAGREGEPVIAAASVGATDEASAGSASRDDGEIAWRLRHLRRSILKDSALTALPTETDAESWFLTDSLTLLGRAVGSSARLAGDFLAQSPLEGQVNFLTTGAFDAPLDLLQLERTRGVAFFAVGAPVGLRGDWNIRAALNQGDLSSWIVAGDYRTRAGARHQYQFGLSYGLHRYEGGSNTGAVAAMSESALNVGAIYGHDAWALTEHVTLNYGAHYAHYDYLLEPAQLSPRVGVTISPTERTRLRASVARHVTAPGAEEFLPPSRAHVLPPQRTFAPLTRVGFRPEDLRHIEVAAERLFDGLTVSVRAFDQSVGDQQVTVFGLRSADSLPADLGHYVVGSVGDVDVRGWGVTLTHALAAHVRGSFDYSLADAEWLGTRSLDRARLSRSVPSALRRDSERLHDFTTTVEADLAPSATRVFVLYKVNSGYIGDDAASDDPGLDGRWDVQITQGLPFLSFLKADWEMLVAVRNLFRESVTERSVYDELLVARPPKRLVGGFTVKF